MLLLLSFAACNDSATPATNKTANPIPGVPPPVKGASPKGDGWKCGDKVCAFSMGEDCMVCPKDCKPCDGCQRKIGEGCTDCKCEACVCKKYPKCCKRSHGWGRKCVEACKKECGGCGRLKNRPTGPPTKGAKSGAPPSNQGKATSSWKCGDGKCVSHSGEDCRVCPKDCGQCSGCQVKVGAGCTDCKCEKCVCKKLPKCCGKNGAWGKECVKACKEQCGGCGVSKAAGSVHAAQPGKASGAAANVPKTLSATCGNNRCELALGEDCESCAKDCSRCNGCLPKLGPGCRNCKCAECVCKKLPECCAAKGRWSIRCVEACREKCGGCGVKAGALTTPPAPAKATSPTPAKVGAASAAARCGDGTCNSGSEDCILCAKDCGNCNGCQAKLGPGCLLCKCEACVCKKRPSCCKATGKWDETCAALCKKDCGGCGLKK